MCTRTCAQIHTRASRVRRRSQGQPGYTYQSCTCDRKDGNNPKTNERTRLMRLRGDGPVWINHGYQSVHNTRSLMEAGCFSIMDACERTGYSADPTVWFEVGRLCPLIGTEEKRKKTQNPIPMCLWA